MTDDDLRAAIADRPDDDTPRLAYADYVEDRGDPARGQFIRDQIRFADTPAWDPFAVNVRHFRKHDIWPGTDFPPPPIPEAGPYVTWHPSEPTHRGFGYGLKVESLYTLLKVAPALFEREPVQHLDLPSGTLDEWRELAASPWFRKVRSVRFTGLTTPIDPLRELAESPNAEGLRSVAFDRCDSPAMPEVLRRMLRSSLGRRLTSLDLRLGEYPEEMVAAFEGDAAELPKLERLRWERMGCDYLLIQRLLASPANRNLASLDLSGNVIEQPRYNLDPDYTSPQYSPTTLLLRECGFTPRSLKEFLQSLFDTLSTALLDITGNFLDETLLNTLASETSQSLRVLRAAKAGYPGLLADIAIESKRWPYLTELDARDNRIGDERIRYVYERAKPENLAAVLLSDNAFSESGREELTHYLDGAAVWE